jgi:hypothetical protein
MLQTLVQLEAEDGNVKTVECTRKAMESSENPALHDHSQEPLQGRLERTRSLLAIVACARTIGCERLRCFCIFSADVRRMLHRIVHRHHLRRI